MKKIILLFCLALPVIHVIAQTKKPVTAVAVNPFTNNRDSASYSLGVRIAQNLKGQGFEAINVALLQKAIADVLGNKKQVLPEEILNQCIGQYQQKATIEKSGKAKSEGKIFLANNAKRKEVVTLPDGLQYEIIKTGTDTIKPTLASKVKCHYHGTLINGTVFDSSVDRGEPINFGLSNVIKGWQEALQLMTVGSKWKLYIPSELAYGDRQSGPVIAPGSTLIFEVELLGIE